MSSRFVVESTARAIVLFALALCALCAAGCASTKVTEIDRTAPHFVPRPDRVLVYDVAATQDEIPSDSSLSPYLVPRDVGLTPEEIELGRRLGGQIGVSVFNRCSIASDRYSTSCEIGTTLPPPHQNDWTGVGH